MAEFVTRIRTESGVKQIDYNALANKPKLEFDSTLTKTGNIADAKATGDAINASADNLSNAMKEFKNEVDTFKTGINGKVDGVSTELTNVKSEIEKNIEDLDAAISELQGDVDGLLAKNDDGETVIQVPLQMNNNKITGLAAPEADTDAATKQYVDSKHFVSTATLSTEWAGDAAPYTQILIDFSPFLSDWI
jgi:archaellum component FlaC